MKCPNSDHGAFTEIPSFIIFRKCQWGNTIFGFLYCKGDLVEPQNNFKRASIPWYWSNCSSENIFEAHSWQRSFFLIKFWNQLLHMTNDYYHWKKASLLLSLWKLMSSSCRIVFHLVFLSFISSSMQKFVQIKKSSNIGQKMYFLSVFWL